MSRIADVVSEAIIVIGADGRITYWNAGAERMFGHPATEMIGQTLLPIIPLRYRERHTAALARLRAGGEMRLAGRTLALEGLHRDGHEIPVELTLTPLAEPGQPDSYIGVLRVRQEPERLEANTTTGEELA